MLESSKVTAHLLNPGVKGHGPRAVISGFIFFLVDLDPRVQSAAMGVTVCCEPVGYLDVTVS